jgi:hypothetical protein
MVFGTVFVLDGGLRIAAATVVRFTGWRTVIGAGVLELVLGALIIDPHVVPYVETVEFVTGFMIVLAGAAMARLGWSLRLLRPGELLPSLFSRGWLPIEDLAATVWSRDGSNGTLIAHVWTAEGTAETPAIPRPVINRYIAAVDRKGVVSTGHAAVELPGVFYASHYPAVEIDRSSPDFQRLLRATPDNDVPGRFLQSYAQEASGWVDSTAKVPFGDFNVTRVTAWWNAYSRDATYNLTNRSCSTTAAYALETALEGVIGARQPRVIDLVHLGLCPELWLAAQLRTRAETMAWTPGLVLDYASALHASLRRMALRPQHPMELR